MQANVMQIPGLEFYLVRNNKDVRKIKKLKHYKLNDIGYSIAKAIEIQNNTTGETIVLVHYPSIMEQEVLDVTCTLIHEACHVFDYTCEKFGYGNDTELKAYCVEDIYVKLFNVYAEWKKVRDAKRA